MSDWLYSEWLYIVLGSVSALVVYCIGWSNGYQFRCREDDLRREVDAAIERIRKQGQS